MAERSYQVHERANHVHDDSLRPFNQDEEESLESEMNGHGGDIMFEPQMEREGTSDEAERAQAVKNPGTPTAKEIAEHEITHLPHRS